MSGRHNQGFLHGLAQLAFEANEFDYRHHRIEYTNAIPLPRSLRPDGDRLTPPAKLPRRSHRQGQSNCDKQAWEGYEAILPLGIQMETRTAASARHVRLQKH